MRGWGWRHVRRSVLEPRDGVFKRGLVEEHRRLRNILGFHLRVLIVRMGGAGRSGECACVSQYVSALISADGWDTKGDFGGRVGECCEFTKAEVWIVVARLVRESCNERACGKSKKRDERPHSPVLRALSLTLFFQGSRSRTNTVSRSRIDGCSLRWSRFLACEPQGCLPRKILPVLKLPPLHARRTRG